MIKKFIASIMIVLLFVTVVNATNLLPQYTAYKTDIPMFFNEDRINFTNPVVIINGNTYIPLREAVEYMGMNIDWSPEEIHISSNNPVLVMSVFPESIGEETYYIRLFENGRLETVFGSRSSNKNLLHNDYMKAGAETASVMLSKDDLDAINALIDKISEKKNNSEQIPFVGWDDGWNVSLCLNNEVYNYALGDYDSDDVKNLVEKIMALSPIDMNLHGWS